MTLTFLAIALMTLASASASHRGKVNPHDVDILVRHVRTSRAKLDLLEDDLEEITLPAYELVERLKDLEDRLEDIARENRDIDDTINADKTTLYTHLQSTTLSEATVEGLVHRADDHSILFSEINQRFHAYQDRVDRVAARMDAIEEHVEEHQDKLESTVNTTCEEIDAKIGSVNIFAKHLDDLAEQQKCHTILVNVNLTEEDTGLRECDVEDVFNTTYDEILPTAFCSIIGIRSYLNEPEYEVAYGQYQPSEIERTGFSLSCYAQHDGTIRVNLLDLSKSSLDENEVTDVYVMVKACSFPPFDSHNPRFP